MYPVPKHLRGITRPIKVDDDNRVHCPITCPCGSSEFVISHTGAVQGNGKMKCPVVAEIDGNFYFIVRAKCTQCDADHLIFDDHYHGWNGYVCAPDEGTRELPRPNLVPWECSKCTCLAHRMQVHIAGEDKEHLLSEGEGILTEEDWHEAFGWLTIDIECVTCEFKYGAWVDYETM